MSVKCRNDKNNQEQKYEKNELLGEHVCFAFILFKPVKDIKPSVIN